MFTVKTGREVKRSRGSCHEGCPPRITHVPAPLFVVSRVALFSLFSLLSLYSLLGLGMGQFAWAESTTEEPTVAAPSERLVPSGVSSRGSAQGGSYSITDVVIVGNRNVDGAAIRVQLTKTKGEIDRATISRDIKTLYQTGFFDQVTASIEHREGSGSTLKYSVVEKPIVRKVFIRGNKEVDESDLVEILQFPGRKFLDRSRVDALIRNARSYYQAQGFYDATLEASVVPVGENQVDVTFTVNEGSRYRIRRISMRGVSEIDPDDLRSEIQTKRYKWWSSWLFGTGRVNNEMLQNDKGLLRQVLLDRGFLDGTVGDPVIEKGDDGLYVAFDITEGPRYRIGSIGASGDLVNGSVEDTTEGIESEPGEVFSATTVREDAFKVSEKYTDVGYAFANVVPNTAINREDRTVDLEFAVSKGKVVRVNRIAIRGNTKTYDHVIRRELRIDEQELFSSSKIRRSQELLQRLGYFEEATITTDPTDRDDTVDLTVNVREGSTGSFSAGVGYSSADGALFNARVAEENLFGTGRRAAINVDVGTERSNYILSLDDRRINDTYLSGGIDLLRTEREFDDFDRTLSGGSVTLGYPLEEMFGVWLEDISFSIKYEYLNVEISNVDSESAAQLVIDSEGTSTSSSFTPRLTRSTINNPLNPTKGSRQVVEVELAGAGGNEQFYLFEARNVWYYPVFSGEWGDLIFSLRTTFGYGDSFDGDPLPLFRRYFPGGINSVRGFRNRSLGPKDAEQNEYGGSKEFVNNAEIIFPLVNSAGLKGVFFWDIGEAFDDDEPIEVSELRQAWGYGIRWTSPLGPIRVEFGYPIGREEGESSPVTLFSFGAPL